MARNLIKVSALDVDNYCCAYIIYDQVIVNVIATCINIIYNYLGRTKEFSACSDFDV